MTVKALHDKLAEVIAKGRGDIDVLFDTEARQARCHYVGIGWAGDQYPDSETTPDDRDEAMDIFALVPDWSKGEFE